MKIQPQKVVFLCLQAKVHCRKSLTLSPPSLGWLSCHNPKAALLWPLGPVFFVFFFSFCKGCQLRSGCRGTWPRHSQMPQGWKNPSNCSVSLRVFSSQSDAVQHVGLKSLTKTIRVATCSPWRVSFLTKIQQYVGLPRDWGPFKDKEINSSRKKEKNVVP